MNEDAGPCVICGVETPWVSGDEFFCRLCQRAMYDDDYAFQMSHAYERLPE